MEKVALKRNPISSEIDILFIHLNKQINFYCIVEGKLKFVQENYLQ